MARYANVSRQTVSNVLNSPEVVKEETRQRVLDAVEALGYRVSAAARQMRTGRSRLLAVRIETTQDGMNVFDRFLHGLTESAARSGYRVLLYTAADDRAEIATIDQLLGEFEPDGFVLTSTHHGDPRAAWLAERALPFVSFGRPWGAPEDVHPWVDVDGAAGTEAATHHLLDAGHRRIGFVGWEPGSGVGDDRRAGWSRALAGRGLDAGLVLETDGSSAQGQAAARELVERGATALVCVSDSVALGALQVIPDVVGFDDTPVAAAVGLTSLSQPLTEAAARCVDLLTSRLSDRPAVSHVLLTPSLVIRKEPRS
ncbi:LacI family DNA-binding transcriptional regulator [Nonomuraea rubra]|uniref:DNA-binding LacI/PurR family transcriptional regulator n=1 Tax=Nonomuraea rubra TaxID=46180 RepID=A0A7X0NY52_9ACTN|nr:LacI family DNA-binding transcriptional regulator [Nonomuraea rubra]MBB6551799.1 DNA-binding LacI/PurR family transcriptional regulator [Nonomuraea rubra]